MKFGRRAGISIWSVEDYKEKIKSRDLNPDQSLFTTVPSSSSSLITMSYFPSILITVRSENSRSIRKHSYLAVECFVFTFLFTLKPLALGSVDCGHLIWLARCSADAGAVHGSDAEVVGAAQAQAVYRVLTNLYWGIIALNPGVTANFTPTQDIGKSSSSSSSSTAPAAGKSYVFRL